MGDQTPLTNADFRKLLQTPRRDQPTPSGKPAATPRRDGQKPKKPYQKPKAQEQDGDEDGPKYRDRAEERRRGINPDYMVANQLISNVLGSGGDVDTSKISVEDSKYLGGDLEHTHLVKGLDYALLNKMRSTMQQGEGEAGEEGAAAGGDGAGMAGALRREELVITHPAARGVYAALFGKKKSNIHEQFLPKRTAFVYSFEADEDGIISDIPTTLRRSKADCPTPAEAVFARMDTSVLERIVKIMSYVKTGKDGKKLKKKDRDEALGELQAGGKTGGGAGGATGAVGTGSKVVPSAAADEPDIFEDAGTDYKPSVTGKKKTPAATGTAPGGGDDMEIDDGHAPPPPPPPSASHPASDSHAGDPYLLQQQRWQQQQQQGYDAGYEGYGGGGYAGGGGYGGEREADVPKWRVRTKKAEERMVDFVDDAYGEYYPMAGGGELPVMDDEEDAGKEDKAGAAGRPGEAEPVKGRQGKGDAARAAARAGDNKLNSQLQKIEGIFKDKGYDTEGFGKTPRRDGIPMGGRTPRIQTGDETPSMKKRRI